MIFNAETQRTPRIEVQPIQLCALGVSALNVFAYLIIAVLLAAASAQAQKDVPYGWHKIAINGQRDEGLKADFDGDRKPDTAVILADDNGRAMGLFAFATSSSRWSKLDSAKPDKFKTRRAAIAKSGNYATDCGQPKDDEECSKDVPAKLVLTRAAIELTGPDVPRKLFYWDRKTKTFKTALIAQ